MRIDIIIWNVTVGRNFVLYRVEGRKGAELGQNGNVNSARAAL